MLRSILWVGLLAMPLPAFAGRAASDNGDNSDDHELRQTFSHSFNAEEDSSTNARSGVWGYRPYAYHGYIPRRVPRYMRRNLNSYPHYDDRDPGHHGHHFRSYGYHNGYSAMSPYFYWSYRPYLTYEGRAWHFVRPVDVPSVRNPPPGPRPPQYEHRNTNAYRHGAYRADPNNAYDDDDFDDYIND